MNHVQKSAGLGVLFVATLALGDPGPQPLPPTPAIAAAKDVPYPGTLAIAVDATDLAHRIFKVREEIPVAAAGDVTLLYPRWIPGTHAPAGTIDRFAGLAIAEAGRKLTWTRDAADVFAFHVAAPAAGKLVVEFAYISPVARSIGDVEVGRAQLVIDWPNLALYPAGYFTRRIPIAPTVRVPDGWQLATALEPTGAAANTFKVVPFETLLDSPIHAGKHLARYDLTPKGDPTRVQLDVTGDLPEQTKLSPQIVDRARSLVAQAYAVFGTRHYDHYDFLLALSDELSGDTTIEHHRGAEYVDTPDLLDDKDVPGRDVIAHEYVHSWDGKFRRPADLFTADYNTQPMRDSLLWVYEGGTQYYGNVLTARAGMWTKQQALDMLAVTVARMQSTAGRSWRPLQDTTSDEIINPRRPMSWSSLQRFEDYYLEGALIWLDADTLIREKTGNKKSLDDFARAFFGGHDRDYTPITYQAADVFAALNAVYAYDWATFWRTRLDQLGKVPLDGLARGGYHLDFTGEESDLQKSIETRAKITDHAYSLGIVLDKDAAITFVAWDSPAAKAGITAGMKLLAVDGLQFEAGRLAKAIATKRPLELILSVDDVYLTKKVDYRGGLRYPHLARDPGHPALLDDILAPR